MASIYARGEVLWMNFKNRDGERECRSTGYRVGQEAQARELASEVERQAAQERKVPVSTRRKRDEPAPAPKPKAAPPVKTEPVRRLDLFPAAPEGALRVETFAEEWSLGRTDLSSGKNEIQQMRLHVFPVIGHMAIADVRPRHIRDLVNILKEKTSDARNCRGGKLAPRTIRHLFAVLRVMFKSAMIDEHITVSPMVVERNVLPKNVDKDPEWRSTAIFEREELVAAISDRRIPLHRRMIYALEGVAGVRHSEAAGLRWRAYDPKGAPLGKLVISRSGAKERTKTQVTREIPVHPVLAALLDEWKASGWARYYGRAPRVDDLMVPTRAGKVRSPQNTIKHFHKDLRRIGLRQRRGHDLRRTFITLLQVDGANRDVIRPLTHPSGSDIMGLYTTFPWPTVCAEVVKLKLTLPTSGEQSGANGEGSHAVDGGGTLAAAASPASTAIIIVDASDRSILDEAVVKSSRSEPTDVARYSRCYTVDDRVETSVASGASVTPPKRTTDYETGALPLS